MNKLLLFSLTLLFTGILIVLESRRTGIPRRESTGTHS